MCVYSVLPGCDSGAAWREQQPGLNGAHTLPTAGPRSLSAAWARCAAGRKHTGPKLCLQGSETHSEATKRDKLWKALLPRAHFSQAHTLCVIQMRMRSCCGSLWDEVCWLWDINLVHYLKKCFSCERFTQFVCILFGCLLVYLAGLLWDTPKLHFPSFFVEEQKWLNTLSISHTPSAHILLLIVTFIMPTILK